MFQGSFVAIITPFKDGKVDEATLRRLVDWHIEEGTDGIVPCGTTGESPTLSHEEHERVIDVVVEAVNKRVPVIAGTGSNSTAEALRLTKHAHRAGADAALVITPYYNKPTQEGMYQHFKKIAEEVPIPMVIYNVPSRTGVNILPETIARLSSELKNIVGVKEASGSLDQSSNIFNLCGDKVTILSGDDSLTLPIMAVGGKGVISVIANILPKDTATMVRLALEGNFVEAQKWHNKLFPLFKAMFIETNPIPVKTAAGMMCLASSEMRLPLCKMSPANEEKLRKALIDYGALK
ncbi:MAG: 4-hydroxy-tetrahydrodipicolinate synthase [bacterium]